MRRSLAVFSTIVIATAVVVPASAQETTTGECPAMHIVMVNSSADSITGSDQVDSGFLAEIATPVLKAANEGETGTTAGFEPIIEDSSDEAFETFDAGIPNMWGETETTYKSEWGNISETATETATAQSSPEASRAEVGRTYIPIRGDRTGSFIPGVHSVEPEPYTEIITRAVDDTMSVFNQIGELCPGTKVVLMGNAQGAQVASTVSKKISAGESSFSADNLVGVALFADPSREDGQATDGMDAIGNLNPQIASGVDGTGVAAVTGQTTATGAAPQNTVSWCLDGDATCGIKKEEPLAVLTAAGQNIDINDPVRSLTYISDVLGPAVMLGGVEALAEGVEMGSGGLRINRANSTDETVLGRIASQVETPVSQTDRERRVVAAGQQIGGMALAAGVTVAKKTLTPANIAQIALAGAVNPAAGAGMALALAGTAALDLVTVETASTTAARVFDEADAAGLETPDVARAAVQSAVARTVNEQTYRTTPVTEDGLTATQATTSWLADLAGDSTGSDLTGALVDVVGAVAVSAFDEAGTQSAMDSLKV